ncbi:hypothetical protein [Microbispora triticiradicis]|uniref:hypothetical protein n=1 Tax=Microbispora triticiradicis TaxID=2200763 RepID=UPI001AD6E769|nr:hypothetical protein [Microbispora triticiradicis]
MLDIGCGTGCLAALLAVGLPPVSSRYTFEFLAGGTVVTSDSTLRFRDRDVVETSLLGNGCQVMDVREAPDRPGREFVFLALRSP